MTDIPQSLVCPKCGGGMRTYERNGVNVDQCTDCKGIFLDRGELERLLEAETGHYGTAGYGGEPGCDDAGGRRYRRRSFLGGLFND